jgi:EAL domain-containing protein (putative c-di-GMP-specific phosphodiesterase class I)
VVVFDPLSTSEEAVAEGSAGEVASVISQRLLRPVYQPIIDLSGGRQIGMEGLIRPIAPAPFANPSTLFAAARAGGHVLKLDLACVDVIVAGARAIEPDQFLSVNLSPASVQASDFSVAALLAILSRHGFPPERLVLELTEREEIDDLSVVRERLDACHAAGIRLSADDVGAGNSGLRLLSELQFDYIKVDLSLVQRSPTSAASAAVIESVVALASRTGALVIGEGVEESAHLAKLGALGVTAAQGYLLGRPEPLAPVAPRASLAAEPERATGVPSGHAAEAASPMSSWRQSIGLPVA